MRAFIDDPEHAAAARSDASGALQRRCRRRPVPRAADGKVARDRGHGARRSRDRADGERAPVRHPERAPVGRERDTEWGHKGGGRADAIERAEAGVGGAARERAHGAGGVHDADTLGGVV
jgi:hypothetical protein